MLSTNSSVSAPVSSRKYSAIVSADRATRRRAPGGSFIWPNTMHGLVDDAACRCRRSWLPAFPARGRSPRGCARRRRRTPSSRRASWRCGRSAPVRMTVLPRPAPPNRPALPPRTNGVSRSMTLMPVSNSSVLGDSSANCGGSRWIGRRSVALTGPRPSIGSPSRLNTRPSVSLPTGTVTGAPVSRTSMPRSRPSVEPRATQRTRPPPRCCCTSPRGCRARLAGTVRRHLDVEGVVDRRQVLLRELGVERRADDLRDFAVVVAVVRSGRFP